MNIFEFNSGDKLFTVNGGCNVLLSAVSDKNVQIGISRMYLKKFAERLDQNYKEIAQKEESLTSRNKLADIFQYIAEHE